MLAIFFWIGFSSAVIVLALSLAPSLAGRHSLRHTVSEQAGPQTT